MEETKGKERKRNEGQPRKKETKKNTDAVDGK
jgi:hypothetical protein